MGSIYFQDLWNLLSTIGQSVFWTQLAFGILLFISLMTTIGLLFWYRSKANAFADQEPSDERLLNKQSQESTDERLPKSQKPTNQGLSAPKQQPDLNAAWNQVSESTDEESGYENTMPVQRNPFMELDRSCTSFRPISQLPNATECVPMTQIARPLVVRPTEPPPLPPVAALNKSTMTLDMSPSKGARPKWAQSVSHQEARRTQIRNATHSHLAQAGHYIALTKERPPTPTRTSSLRKPKSKRAKASYLNSADPLPASFQQSYEA